MLVDGFEEEIWLMLRKPRKKVGGGNPNRERKKNLVSSSRFERELKRLDYSISYGGSSSGSRRRVDAREVSGGILLFWDNRVLDLLELEQGGFSIFGCFKSLEDGFVWVFTSVYGLLLGSEKKDFWDELGAIRDMRTFTKVIEEKDLPLFGSRFTWCRGINSQAASRLDRFLVTDEREDHFSGILQYALTRTVLDHCCPIVFEGGGVKKGKTPFRFENMWLLLNGFKELVRKWWWTEYIVTGTSSHCLAEKLKALKKDLGEWNKKVFGNVSISKLEAFAHVQLWDLKEMDNPLSLMANAHARRNLLTKVKINGVTLIDEDEIKARVCRAYQALLSNSGDWRSRVRGLQFGVSGEDKSRKFELPFTEEEVFEALYSLLGDKALGLDSFTLAFW
ncbi:hypothetical protein VitviT2T_016814 [Vitis vinifera]|nr:hypothetical protein VitviT2T_016814 [Vitis vinifera]